MVLITVLALLLCGIGVLSVTLGSQTTLMLEVEAGDDFTLWYQHSVKEPAYISWFKHTNTSVPDRLTCLYYKLFSSPSPCHFVPQTNRMAMSVNSKITSLTITGVNYTDSGLYYCCIQRNTFITFSNATLLLVQANGTYSKASPDVFFHLTVGFGVGIVVLLCILLVLVFMFVKNKRQHQGTL